MRSINQDLDNIKAQTSKEVLALIVPRLILGSMHGLAWTLRMWVHISIIAKWFHYGGMKSNNEETDLVSCVVL